MQPSQTPPEKIQNDRVGGFHQPWAVFESKEKIGFLSEPNCIRHLAAQSEVTHAILRYKEVEEEGEKEKKQSTQGEWRRPGCYIAMRPIQKNLPEWGA
jgi:hypothetical protein